MSPHTPPGGRIGPFRVGPLRVVLVSMLALTLALTVAVLDGGLPPEATATHQVAEPATRITAPNGRRPNVIVVMMDDMRADELRYMPSTRRFIARRGLNFRNSFSPYPLCCPARASFLLGTSAHNHRVLYHEAPYGFGSLRDDVTVASRMRKVGYQTAMVGKYLNRYGIQRSRVTKRSSVRYVPNGWKDWMVGLDDGWGGSGGTYSYDNFTQNVNGRVRHHRGIYSSRLIADQVRGLIGRYHRKVNPFFIWINPVAPHFGGPREPDDPKPVKTRRGETVRFKTPARPRWVRGRFDRVIRQAHGVRANGGPAEKAIGDKPANIRRWPEMRKPEKRAALELQRQRAESLFAWDREFGRIVRKLKRTGEYDDTILMFTSDNGYFVGEHRIRQGKIRPHEPALKVPFLVAGPGIRKGSRYHPITTYDITATVLDIGRAARLPRMDGASRLPIMTGPDRNWTRPVVVEGLLTNLRRKGVGIPSGLTISGLRTARYKLIRYSTGEGELYDLFADPNELTNLWKAPRYRKLRNELLGQWRKYRACRGSGCRQPLPAKYRATPAFGAKQYLRATRQYNAYYR